MDKQNLNEEEFKKLSSPGYDLEKEKEEENQLIDDIYENIIEIIKYYCDIKEDYYPIISCWIIGTYLHHNFISFPYLFFNAMRGSGKSRLLRLITYLSKNGEILTSLTEAVLFRTKGTLGIDEFESVGRKGKENVRELLNSCYKKGIKVKRMKQVKTQFGTKQVLEEFEPYRPIVMANIWGMEEVLGDRCITLILERSSDSQITDLVETFESDNLIQKTKKLLLNYSERCSLCSDVVVGNVYANWNFYVKNNYINTINYINYTNYTNYTQGEIYSKIRELGFNGRELELSLPLIIVSTIIKNSTFEKILHIIEKIMKDRREDQFTESQDVSFIDFISQEMEVDNFIFLSELTRKFKEFLNSNEEWITDKWVGWALRRLNLRKEHKRSSKGVIIKLDYKKAQEKIRMFK